MPLNRPREIAPSKLSASPISKPAFNSMNTSKQLPKRSKTDRACINCRTLRRKCTGDHPCHSCVTNDLSCSYGGNNERGPKMTLGTAVEYITKLEERLRAYEARESTHAFSLSSKKHYANLEHHLVKSSTSLDGHEMGPLLRGTNQLNSATLHPEFWGPSASDAVMDRIETSIMNGKQITLHEMDREPSESLSEDRLLMEAPISHTEPLTRPLPPKPVVDQYVQRYFTTTHRLYPILEERAFWIRYSQFWMESTKTQSNCSWSALLYIILALGHQLAATDTTPHHDQVHNPDDHGAVYFDLAKSMIADGFFAGGDLFAIHCMFLAYVWLYNEQRLHEAYLMLGASTRTAYGIGMHRDSTNLNISHDENASRVATWWCHFINETQNAALLGRPCAIQLDEVDIPMFPLDMPSVEFRYIEKMRQISRLLWEGYYEVYSLIYKGSNVIERAKISAQNDAAMCAWRKALCPSRAESSHESIIHMYTHFCRILISRPFLALFLQKQRKDPRIEEVVREPSARCIDVSIKLVELITTIDWESCGTLHAALFQATHFLWNGLLSLLLYISESAENRTLEQDRDKIEGHIQVAIQWFSKYQHSLPMARAAAENATRLLNRANGENHIEDLGFDFFPNIELAPSEAYFDFLSFSDLPNLGWNHEAGDLGLAE